MSAKSEGPTTGTEQQRRRNRNLTNAADSAADVVRVVEAVAEPPTTEAEPGLRNLYRTVQRTPWRNV
jgi:hypothetical protein